MKAKSKQEKKGYYGSKKDVNEVLKSQLVKHDLLYCEYDMEVVWPFIRRRERSKDWIKEARYRLQLNSGRSERRFGKFLLSRHIEFVHKAPFAISGEICFVDFYLPQDDLVILITDKEDKTKESEKKRENKKCEGIRLEYEMDVLKIEYSKASKEDCIVELLTEYHVI